MNIARIAAIIAQGKNVSQPWAPDQAGTLALDLDPVNSVFTDATKASAVTVDGATVGCWGDSSGNGRDLSMATAANRPILKTNIINGKPVLRFDGNDDRLGPTAFALTASTTVFFVHRVNLFVANSTFFDGTAENSLRLYSAADASRRRMYAGAFGPLASVTDGQFALVECLYSGAGSRIAVNGGADTTGNPGAAAGGGFSLGKTGSDLSANMDVARILVYSGALDTANRAKVVEYITGLYGPFF